jgi:hypothetical protein
MTSKKSADKKTCFLFMINFQFIKVLSPKTTYLLDVK